MELDMSEGSADDHTEEAWVAKTNFSEYLEAHFLFFWLHYRVAVTVCATCDRGFPSKVTKTVKARRPAVFVFTELRPEAKYKVEIAVRSWLNAMIQETVSRQRFKLAALHIQRTYKIAQPLSDIGGYRVIQTSCLRSTLRELKPLFFHRLKAWSHGLHIFHGYEKNPLWMRDCYRKMYRTVRANVDSHNLFISFFQDKIEHIPSSFQTRPQFHRIKATPEVFGTLQFVLLFMSPREHGPNWIYN